MEQISSDATDTKIEMPSPLQWRNLNVSSRLMERKLLDNVSGEIKHNHFCAIMGPSGSGKSTLLNALACRLDRNIDSQGELLLFGKKYSLSDIKQRGGYVMQDDLLNEFLTVEETLLFTANLRMKPNTSPEAQQERVDEVIRLLGLESCRKVVIGGATRKGISGGERKRVSIGIELLPFPQLLFLDEPTSGLDSVSSLALCRILRSLAHQECAIIATIHQPQFRIFELFDDLILLKSGHFLYSGPAAQASEHWASAGMPVPAGTNVADHLLDSITPELNNQEAAEQTENAIKLRKIYEQIPTTDPLIAKDSEDKPLRATQSWCQQFRILTKRSFNAQIRQWKLIVVSVIQTIVMSILIGTVFLRIGHYQSSITKRQPVLFFCVINQGVFGSMQMINSFPSERILTLRERAAGTYLSSAYFMAKSASEAPAQLLQPIIFSLIVYWITGFQDHADKWFIFCGFMILCNAAAVSLALMVSAVMRTTNAAVTILPLLMEMNRLFGGFFLSPAMLPSYFSWLDALSYVKYTYIGIALNELSHLDLECLPSELKNGVCPVTHGEQTLQTLGMNNYSMGMCAGILIALIFGMRLAAYLAVRFLKR